jgi:hypothetical protein
LYDVLVLRSAQICTLATTHYCNINLPVLFCPVHGNNSNSPTGLSGDASPFARRNDIIRNSLSSLTASLDLPRSTVVGVANRKCYDTVRALQWLHPCAAIGAFCCVHVTVRYVYLHRTLFYVILTDSLLTCEQPTRRCKDRIRSEAGVGLRRAGSGATAGCT